MPGAKITERIDATHYKGTITVRLGPATMAFKGDIEVIELDPAARSLHLVGKGADATGTSAASMDLSAAVQASRRDLRSDRQERSDDERQGGRARRPADGTGGRSDAQAVRRQLRGAAADAAAAAAASEPAGTAPGGAAVATRQTPQSAPAVSRGGNCRAPPPNSTASRSPGPCCATGCAGCSRARRPERRDATMATDRMNDVVSLQQQLEQHGFIAERSFAATLLLTMDMRRPLLLEGEAGRRQDRSRQGAGAAAGYAADPAAMLRRARRAFRAVRMELPASAAGDQAAGTGRAADSGQGAGHLLRALSAQAAAARSDHARRLRRCC